MTSVDRGRRLFVGAAAAGTALAIARPSLGRATSPVEEPRRRIPLDTGWKFHLGHADLTSDFNFGLDQRTFAKAGAQTADAARADFDEAAGGVRSHDWAVELPTRRRRRDRRDRADQVAAHGSSDRAGASENSIGWYRRRLDLAPPTAISRHWLEFDGVFRDCLVFINGYIVGRNESGYAPFRVDITDYLEPEGPNQLCVRVDATLGRDGSTRAPASTARSPWSAPIRPHPAMGTFVRTVAVDGGGARCG